MYKKAFLFQLLIVLAVSAQITVIENTNERCVFTWDMENYSVNTFQNKGKTVSSISFPGENIMLGEKNEPVIPGKTLIFGLAPEGEIGVSFTAKETKVIGLDAPLVTHEFSAEKRRPDFSYINPWVISPQYSKFHNLKTALLVIRPFIYDSISKKMTILTKGECIINYSISNYRAINSNPKKSEIARSFLNTLINKEIAENWWPGKTLNKRSVQKFPIKNDQTVYRFKIGDGHSGVNEGTTYENGLIKIPGDSIIKYFGSGVKTSEVRLFASIKGELPTVLEKDSLIPDGIIEIPLFRVDTKGDATVGPSDYFLAHVTGASDWYFNSRLSIYDYKLNRYSDDRNYMITVSKGVKGLSSSNFASKSGSGDTLHNFENKILFKSSVIEPKNNDGEASLKWVWAKINAATNTFSLQLDIPDVDTTEPGMIYINYRSSNSFDAFLGSKKIYSNGYQDDNYVKNWNNKYLTIKYNGYPGSNSETELLDLTVTYKRLLTAGNSAYLEIFSSVDSGIHIYNLKVTTDELLYIFMISDDEKTFALIDTIRNYKNRTFSWSDSGGTGNRYVVCSEKKISTLPVLSKQSTSSGSFIISDLRATNDTTDYLIISPKAFLKSAQKLATHKKKMGYKPRIAVVDDIYTAFSGGTIDPSALRNFIMYVKENWAGGEYLSYVVLFGSGHYDYKNIITNEPVYVPVYYDEYYTVEDYFVSFSSNGFLEDPQMALGRFPCKSEAEADAIVSKIIQTEDPSEADFSDWRNRALFVADDDYQGYAQDNVSMVSPHHISSDNVAAIFDYMWPSVQMNKVYLFDYKWNSAREKPEASRAIINGINNGVSYVDYFGHGSALFWADERVLVIDDIQKMSNYKKYPLVSSFSCSVGEFDMPGIYCFSAALVNAPNAGAIATVSSSRQAFASTNEALARSFYTVLLADTASGTSIGSALALAKIEGISSNTITYSILGDPSICFMRPKNRINLQITNENDVAIDTLKALQMIKIKGTIVDRKGNKVKGADGAGTPSYVQIGLYNPQDTASRKDGGVDVIKEKPARYVMPGKPVYSGRVKVENGQFSQTILISKNLSFDREGVKLTAYCWNEKNNTVALGTNKTPIIFHGTDPGKASSLDSTGPQISIKPLYDFAPDSNAKPFVTGRLLKLDSLKCVIDIFDENGVDVVGSGPDEGLTLEIAGVFSKENINHKFQFKDGDYRSGNAIIKEAGLQPGIYKMSITARDLIGNVSSETFTVEIIKTSDLQIANVFNSPNPMKMGSGTRFYFYSTDTYDKSVTATIKIYTLSGKPVKIFKSAVNGIFWDGRDQVGNMLSPDIYLYQITLNSSTSGKTVKSKIGKIIINPPR